MRQRTERVFGEHASRVRYERVEALEQWNGSERACCCRFVCDTSHFPGIHTDRFFDQERITLVEQEVRGRSHVAVTTQCDDEIGSGLRKELARLGKGRRPAQLCRTLRRHLTVRILNADELDLRHAHERLQVRSVVQRMPVAHPDRSDA